MSIFLEDRIRKLGNSINYNNLKAVKEILRQHPTLIGEINKYMKSIEPYQRLYVPVPLHHAIFCKHYEIALYLIQNTEVDVNSSSGQYDYTVMHFAAVHGTPEIIRALAERGADIDSSCMNWLTPLMIASGEGKYDNVMELLKLGASVNALNEKDSNALSLSGGEGDTHLEIVKVLVANGANIFNYDEVGDMPIDYFISRNRPKASMTYILKKMIESNEFTANDFHEVIDTAIGRNSITFSETLDEIYSILPAEFQSIVDENKFRILIGR